MNAHARVGMAILVCLLMARPSAAQDRPLRIDWPSVAASIAGQTADQWSTYKFLRNGSGCTERNRFMGQNPSTPRIVLQEAASTGGLVALQIWMAHLERHTQKAGARRVVRWVSRYIGYGNGAVGVKSTIHNVRLCGW